MANDSFWFDVETQAVVRASKREGDAWLGPFSTPDEAQDAPAMFIAHAQAWLESEEGQRYLAMAEELGLSES